MPAEATLDIVQQRRAEIVDAAERCVKAKGLHYLKLRDVARESGKSLGNLYNYFQNKEAIVEALVERALGELLAAEDMLRSAAARREVVQSTLVPLVDTQYAEAREVARLGEVNTIILLESLKAQLDARRRLIATYRDEALAAVELARIVGPTIVRSSEGQHP